MERRALIAVVISIAILVLYQEVVMKRFYKPSTPTAEDVQPAAAPTPIQSPSAEAPAPPAIEPVANAAEPPVAGTDVVVDTDLFHAVFTTAGGRLKSIELKRYRSSVSAGSPPLQLVQFPVDANLPLALILRGAASLDDSRVVYQVDRAQIVVSSGGHEEITFTGELAGATVRKRIGITGDQYAWSFNIEIDKPPSAYTEMAVGWSEGLNPAGPHAGEVVFDSIVMLKDDKLRHEAFTNLDAGLLVDSNIAWVAFSGPYFMAALAPDVPATNAQRAWAKRSEHTVDLQLLFPPGTFASNLAVYTGPKEIDRLETAGHGLRRAVDLGFFTFVALPMLQGLRFLYRFTGNYGVAIILLTVVIKLLFYPLTRKSFESMRAMQKLQPEMAKIREKLADKPEEMNREIMELYKRHKVNPLGGCLPMVLQLPVFIGLYSALQHAIELRHAPFLGWIHDLSAPDRLGALQLPFVEHPGIPVLTLLMGVSMFVQQWMTPTAADPAQQRVMMIMPLMFTFMFINFPAGLTLYWLTNNLLTIAQQYAMTRNSQR
jgi:YidC/Oxa1 family membrane protein insertase